MRVKLTSEDLKFILQDELVPDYLEVVLRAVSIMSHQILKLISKLL